MIAGISGYQRNGAVAVGSGGRLAAVCEQGRVIRVRDIGLKQSGFPSAAFSAAVRAARGNRARRQLATSSPKTGSTVCLARRGESIITWRMRRRRS